MAERRSIYKKISLSEAIDSMTNWAQLFFTWSIPHADDVGLLPRAPKVIKGMVFPLKENLPSEKVEGLIQECLQHDLYREVEINGKKYLYVTKFNEHQTLKKDRQPQLIFDFEYEDTPAASWKKVEAMVSKWIPNGTHPVPEGKGREEKGREEERGARRTAPQEKSVNGETPTAADFISFFHTACVRIRGVKPIIDGGKDGKLIKTRLRSVQDEIGRLERMAVWYLTRTKQVKDTKGNWRSEYKHPPAIATMLSTSYFNQLLSEEHNALTYMQENLEWIERIYANTDAKVYKMRSIADEMKALSAKLNVKN